MSHNLKRELVLLLLVNHCLCMTKDGELETQPFEVLQHKYLQHKVLEILVQWKGLLDCENLQELCTSFHYLFPYFPFENKVPLDRMGNVRTHVYISCRKKEGEKRRTSGSSKLRQMSCQHIIQISNQYSSRPLRTQKECGTTNNSLQTIKKDKNKESSKRKDIQKLEK